MYRTYQDRRLFLELLEEMSVRFNVEVSAYVLMSNHYHLLVKTLDGNLSKAMQWFGTSYTRKFNIANRTGGHLFQGRFKSIIVQNDAYLLQLSCYIHRNPLRAGMVERLADYKWSSYPRYAYKKTGPEWLKTDAILNQFSGKDKRRAYRNKVQRYSDEEQRIWEDVKHGLIYGSENFVSDIRERFLKGKKKEELPQHNSLFRECDLGDLLEKASAVLGFDLVAACNAKKVSPVEKDHRDLLVHLLWEAGRLSNREIGGYFGLTYSAVSRRVKLIADRLRVDGELRQTYDALKSKIKV